MRSVVSALAALAWLASAAPATAQAKQVRAQAALERGPLYAGMPFALQVVAEGFDESPEPTVAPFEIPGARVALVGVSPNVMRMSVNGRTTTRVQFAYRYRVEAPAPGTYRIPPITIEQNGVKATTRPHTARVLDLESTQDMAIRVVLPERPVTVGETFEASVDWYLRRDPGNQSFAIPLFDATEWVELHAPELPRNRRGQAVAFTVGDRDVELPFTREQAALDGAQYTRFRFTVSLTPLKAGRLELPSARVVAQLKVGERRGAFGFVEPRYALYKAEGPPQVLEVRALPAAGRPASFAGAVGTKFSIEVEASRTVVRVGEPIELTVTIRGDGRMEGLALPPLSASGDGGLPADVFSVLDSPGTGEIGEDGASKQFRVTVRLETANVREIPPIPFSYYDAKQAAYATVRSEPVALSVEGSAVVGAGDVVSGTRTGPDPLAPVQPTAGGAVGADLSLSAPDRTLDTAWTTRDMWPALLALYVLPLLALGFRLWQVTTAARRDHRGEVARALRALERAVESAAREPARESAPRVLSALRGLARSLGRAPGNDDDGDAAAVIARLETEAFDPRAASDPMAAPLRDEVLALARGWVASARRDEPGRGRGSASAAMLALVALVALIWAVTSVASPGSPGSRGLRGDWTLVADVRASDTGEPTAEVAGQGALADARSVYQRALASPDRDARTRGFADAERRYRALVRATPDRPELLTDWGNAALGARELGWAAVAYRRALALDPRLGRAETNLDWMREQQARWMRPASRAGAAESLLFWRDWRVSTRHLIGAVCFAIAVLLLVPWGDRRSLRWFALAPAAIWLTMMFSLLLADAPVDDAVVVVDGAVLRSADSPGARPALPDPVPAGAEVTIAELRGEWVRVSLPDGQRGWLPASSIERVLPAGR